MLWGKKYTFIDMAGQSGVTSSKNEKNVKKQGTAINLNMLALKMYSPSSCKVKSHTI